MANPPEDRGATHQPFVAIPPGPPGSPVNYQPVSPQRPVPNQQRQAQPAAFVQPPAPQNVPGQSQPYAPGGAPSTLPGQPQPAGGQQLPYSPQHQYLSEHDERKLRVGPYDPGFDEEISYSPSLARRMAQWYASDPLSGTQHIVNPVTSTGLAVPDFAMAALLSVTGGDIRIRVDGFAATSGLGLYVAQGAIVKLTGRPSMHQFQMINVANVATVDIIYFQ